MLVAKRLKGLLVPVGTGLLQTLWTWNTIKNAQQGCHLTLALPLRSATIGALRQQHCSSRSAMIYRVHENGGNTRRGTDSSVATETGLAMAGSAMSSPCLLKPPPRCWPGTLNVRR